MYMKEVTGIESITFKFEVETEGYERRETCTIRPMKEWATRRRKTEGNICYRKLTDLF
jgi:hypothetical protein